MITLSTAAVNKQGDKLRIDPRSYPCMSQYHLCKELRRHGFLADHNASEQCQKPLCQRQRWNVCALCIDHLASAALRNFNKPKIGKSTAKMSELTLRQRLRSQQQDCPVEWSSARDMLLAKHKDLLFIDMEFSFSSTMIFSIALVDSKGAIISHILVDNAASDNDLGSLGESIPPYSRIVDRIVHNKVNATPHEQYTIKLKPAATIWHLRTMIHPKTVLIGWGSHDVDLRNLRKFADVHGDSAFLPLPNSSPPGIPLLKTVLPGLPTYAMDVVFPALFPNDELVGWNHFADADALMCFKVVNYCIEALNPSGNLPAVGRLQATLDECWRSTPAMLPGANRQRLAVNDAEED